MTLHKIPPITVKHVVNKENPTPVGSNFKIIDERGFSAKIKNA